MAIRVLFQNQGSRGENVAPERLNHTEGVSRREIRCRERGGQEEGERAEVKGDSWAAGSRFRAAGRCRPSPTSLHSLDMPGYTMRGLPPGRHINITMHHWFYLKKRKYV